MESDHAVMVQHQIELKDPRTHLFYVTLSIPRPAPSQIFSMAVWIPGSYLVREFSKQVQNLAAMQDGQAIAIAQINKNTWQLANAGMAPLTVSYQVYAFDASVRTAFLDGTRGFFNGTSLFMRVLGREHERQQVVIKKSALVACDEVSNNWRVATAMPAHAVDSEGWGVYEASSYDELADNPFELGQFWEDCFTVRGIAHRLIVSGAATAFDGARLLADTQAIVQSDLAFWHGENGTVPPSLQYKGYVFMLRAVDDGYGGLEHLNSTALIAKRSDLPRVGEPVMPSGYVTLLGLISHEYFHTWNVKRLRPAQLVPYDYERENYTPLLWFFEGFTSYYDDLLLCRAGLIDEQTYLDLLAKTINQVQQTPGRLVHSLSSSSFEAWTKYYRTDENSVNSTVSYYGKGSLVALCLDARLRANGGSLDQMMRTLWERYAANSTGSITEADIMAAIADPDTQQALRDWVHTTTELPLSELLCSMGVETIAVKASLAQQLGVRVKAQSGNIQVTHVLADTLAAKAGFAAGDEWLAVEVDGQTWRINSLEDVLVYAPAGKSFAAWVARDKKILSFKLTLPSHPMTNADVRLIITNDMRAKMWLRPFL